MSEAFSRAIRICSIVLLLAWSLVYNWFFFFPAVEPPHSRNCSLTTSAHTSYEASYHRSSGIYRIVSFIFPARQSLRLFTVSGSVRPQWLFIYPPTLTGSPILTRTVERSLKKLPYSIPTGTIYRGIESPTSPSAEMAMRKIPFDSGRSECIARWVPSGKITKGTLSFRTSTALFIVSLFLRTSSIPSLLLMIGIIFRKDSIEATLRFLKISARATKTFSLPSMVNTTRASIRAFVWLGA